MPERGRNFGQVGLRTLDLIRFGFWFSLGLLGMEDIDHRTS